MTRHFKAGPPGKLPRAYVFGLRPWEEFLGLWLPNRQITRIDRNIGWQKFFIQYAWQVLICKQSEIYVWGYKHPNYLTSFCRFFGVPLVRIEDGFLRSISLGEKLSPPISLCFDNAAAYFDSTQPSLLESIIQNYDFEADEALMRRARIGLRALVESRLSKYNFSEDGDVANLFGPKTRERILVVGQVESDMSLIKGDVGSMTNNDLVRAAALENPHAQIIYKPHPAVLSGTSISAQSDPKLVRDIALVLNSDLALADAFQTIDRVYTMTSLAGFEALIRSIPVTCFGMPFYAGWGATDDRRVCQRRVAKRTAVQIFAASYILYPKYFDPIRKRPIKFEQALELLKEMKIRQKITNRP